MLESKITQDLIGTDTSWIYAKPWLDAQPATVEEAAA